METSNKTNRKIKYLVAIIIYIALSFATLIALTDNSYAAPDYCPVITSIESSNGSITIHWSKTDNPSYTDVEVYYNANGGNGYMKKTKESDQKMSFNLAPGKYDYGTSVMVMLRATFKYTDATHWTDPEYVTLRSGNGGGWNLSSAISVKDNTWYKGMTNDCFGFVWEPAFNWYKFRTSKRTDSLYKLSVLTTSESDLDCSYAEFFDGDSYDSVDGNVAASQGDYRNTYNYRSAVVSSLEKNKTYYVRVFNNEALANKMDGGVEYKVKVKEIIKKPQKGKIISIKTSGRTATVKFKKIKNVKGYQIALKKSGNLWKYYKVSGTQRTFKRLSFNRHYFIKIRGYRIVNGKKYYGVWSNTKNVFVRKKHISKCKISLKKEKYHYTGKRIKPAVRIKDNGRVLRKGRDYSLKYINNKKPGTAKIIIKGKGNYKGTVKRTFIITDSRVLKVRQYKKMIQGAVSKKGMESIIAGFLEFQGKNLSTKTLNNIPSMKRSRPGWIWHRLLYGVKLSKRDIDQGIYEIKAKINKVNKRISLFSSFRYKKNRVYQKGKYDKIYTDSEYVHWRGAATDFAISASIKSATYTSKKIVLKYNILGYGIYYGDQGIAVLKKQSNGKYKLKKISML